MTKMKLFKVKLSLDLESVVLAENEKEARGVAVDYFKEIIEESDVNNKYDWDVEPLKDVKDLPYHWERNCLPWCDTIVNKEEFTVGQLLDIENGTK